jgi:hypothetical protein
MKKVTLLDTIKARIHTIRGKQVLLDRDLAELYEVETRYLNKMVKRNKDRFPPNFMFYLKKEEISHLMFQFGTSNWGGTRKPPSAFTEQGVAMLSGILRSKRAIEVSIRIMNAFVLMRRFLSKNAEIFQRLDRVELKQIEHDNNFEKIFKALETEKPKQGIFYNGQIFDAYVFICDLIRTAKNKIILIDNYIDETVLELFTKTNVTVTIYTKNMLRLDYTKYKQQYKNIELKKFTLAHDRFLIIDQELYHIGASLKDLGKKWMAFSKMDMEFLSIIEKLENNQ